MIRLWLLLFTMKLSIRLQNHGCRNYPYWWIVVAPNRKNIFGRFTEHVGYWSPREKFFTKRQVILNMPRIKYWISCGAVPTPRVHRFLAMWNLMPVPWHYKKSQEELAKLQKPEEEMTEEEKITAGRKLRRSERDRVDQFLVQSKSYFKYHDKGEGRRIINAMSVNERENDIIRELLLKKQYSKIHRVAELTNGPGVNVDEQLLQLREAATQARAEVALLHKNYRNSRPMFQIEAMRKTEALEQRIEELERRRPLFSMKDAEEWNADGFSPDLIDKRSKELLDRKIHFELVLKKMSKLNEDMKRFSQLDEPVTLEEYANFLYKENMWEERVQKVKAKGIKRKEYYELMKKKKANRQLKINNKKRGIKPAAEEPAAEEPAAEEPAAEEPAGEEQAEEAAVDQALEAAVEEAVLEEGENPGISQEALAIQQEITAAAEEDQRNASGEVDWAEGEKAKFYQSAFEKQLDRERERHIQILTEMNADLGLDRNGEKVSHEDAGPQTITPKREAAQRQFRIRYERVREKILLREAEANRIEAKKRYMCLLLAKYQFVKSANKRIRITRGMLDDLAKRKVLAEEDKQMNDFFAKNPDFGSLIKKFLLVEFDLIIPTKRPVNPFPDLATYLPTDFYEPIVSYNLQIRSHEPIEPNDEVLKYNSKRKLKKDKIDPTMSTHESKIQQYLAQL